MCTPFIRLDCKQANICRSVSSQRCRVGERLPLTRGENRYAAMPQRECPARQVCTNISCSLNEFTRRRGLNTSPATQATVGEQQIPPHRLTRWTS